MMTKHYSPMAYGKMLHVTPFAEKPVQMIKNNQYQGGAFPLAAIIAGATTAHAALQKIQPATKLQSYLETADWLNGKRDSVPYKVIKGGTQALKSFFGYGFLDGTITPQAYNMHFARWISEPEQKKWLKEMKMMHKPMAYKPRKTTKRRK